MSASSCWTMLAYSHVEMSLGFGHFVLYLKANVV